MVHKLTHNDNDYMVQLNAINNSLELSPLGEVHGFCSHINWRNNPGVSCGDIMGYQVKLINPSTRKDVIRKVDNLGTFYALVKDDEEYKQVDTEVQVFSQLRENVPI